MALGKKHGLVSLTVAANQALVGSDRYIRFYYSGVHVSAVRHLL